MGKEHYMSGNEWKMFNHQKKKDKIFEQNRFYCKCGHSISIMPKTINTICSNCGHLVFRDKDLQEIYDREMENREKKMKFKKELRKYL
jgi:protein associated with RNAse G/E